MGLVAGQGKEQSIFRANRALADCSPGACTVQGSCSSGFIQVCHEGSENECLDINEWPDHCANDGDTCGACTNSGGSAGCFSATSNVVVQGKGPVAMKDIQAGDMVMVDGSRFEPIYAMGHRQENQMAAFVKISTTKESVEVTPEHLIPVVGKAHPVRADSVEVGDYLFAVDGERRVTKVGSVEKQGLYDPLTPSGKIVVDGLIASTYIALQENDEHVTLGGFKMSHEDLVHLTLAPMRVVCMGITDAPCRLTNEEGIPLYIRWGIDVIQMATEGSIFASVFLFVIMFPLFLAFAVVEALFGASNAPLALFAAGVVIKLFKSGSNKKAKAV